MMNPHGLVRLVEFQEMPFIIIYMFCISLVSAVFLMRKILHEVTSRVQPFNFKGSLMHPSATPSLAEDIKSLRRIRCNRFFKSKITMRKMNAGRVTLNTPNKFREQLKTLFMKRKQAGRILETQQSIVHHQTESLEQFLLHPSDLKALNRESVRLLNSLRDSLEEMIEKPLASVMLSAEGSFHCTQSPHFEQVSSEESVRSLKKDTHRVQTLNLDTIAAINRGSVHENTTGILTRDKSMKILETLFAKKTSCPSSRTSVSPFEPQALKELLSSERLKGANVSRVKCAKASVADSGDYVYESESVVMYDPAHEISESYVSIGFSAGDISFLPNLELDL